MEGMGRMKSLFGKIYQGKRVLVTGHTGFKGSWLAKWLNLMGAEVYGYALKPPSVPNHISLIGLNINSMEADIRDSEKLFNYMHEIRPDIVFHLAAQPLVRASYADPLETYSTNVIGTLNLMEACRKTDYVKAIINVTSDKCYENKEWVWGYRETDPMGGYDPYSSSKGCAEILTSSYRNSYFNLSDYGIKHNTLLATGRAGNVIGGGDWAEDRLIPDIVKAAAGNYSVPIRNPLATRPWQHVLEAITGYLTLGWRLLEEKPAFSGGWNFGPGAEHNITVNELYNRSERHWGKIKMEDAEDRSPHHEAYLLMLDSSKAYRQLNWKPVWNIDKTIRKTILWYKEFYEKDMVNTENDIHDYIYDAVNRKLVWAV
jgi:CDP-glucose 4,6-dehydratase